MSYRLGVDLGTTFTAAAVSNGMPATMVGLGNRALQIPSVLFLTPEGDFLVGESAERRGLAQPDRVVREFKRRIGDSVPMLIAGAPYSPQSLTARLLRHVCGTATERMGEAPEQIVLTHPANWGPYKLELLDQVASLADIGPVVRCPEPLAAAAQYASQNRVEVGDTIAVYDLGGGTFDACVLRKTATGFALLGNPEGIEHLGGIDFDEALFQHAIGMLGDRISHLDPEDLETVIGLARLRRDCVDTKEALSADTDALLAVSLPGLSTTLRLNRTELEALVRPALVETVEAMARTLRSAEVTPEQVTAIVLVGGSSRIPLVGELLQRAFGRPTALDTHPKHDVALGAVQSVGLDDSGSPPPSAVSTLRPTTATVLPAARRPGSGQPPAVPETDGSTVEAPPAARDAEEDAAVTTAGSSAARTGEPGPGQPPAAGADLGASTAAEPSIVGPAVPRGPAARRRRAPDRDHESRERPGTRRPQAPVSPPGKRRRRLLVTCVAAGAVIAGVVAGIVWVNRPSTVGGEASAISGAPFDSSTPTANGKQLPVSTPLTPTQLIVPVQIGANWDLWLADTTAQAPVLRLTSDPLPDTTPAVSPDRRTVIYTHDLNLDGKRTLLVKGASAAGDGQPLFDPMPAECRGTIARPAWNPIRTDELAVPCIDEAGKAGLYRMTTDGQILGSVQLPAGAGRVDDPAYSPDGTQLLFWAAPMSTWEGGTLYTVPVASGAPKVLLPTTRRGEDADGVWAPDGKHVVFRRRMPDGTTGGNFDIFQVTTDGRARLERLTDDPADEQDPTYSPSGDEIAFKSAAQDPKRPVNDVSRIWLMDSSGHNQHVLWSEGPDAIQTAAGWGRR